MDTEFDNTSVEDVVKEVAAKYRVPEDVTEQAIQALQKNGIFIMEGLKDMSAGMFSHSLACARCSRNKLIGVDHWDKLGVPLLLSKALQDRVKSGPGAPPPTLTAEEKIQKTTSGVDLDIVVVDAQQLHDQLQNVSLSSGQEQQARIKQLLSNSAGGLSYTKHLMVCTHTTHIAAREIIHRCRTAGTSCSREMKAQPNQ